MKDLDRLPADAEHVEVVDGVLVIDGRLSITREAVVHAVVIVAGAVCAGAVTAAAMHHHRSRQRSIMPGR